MIRRIQGSDVTEIKDTFTVAGSSGKEKWSAGDQLASWPWESSGCLRYSGWGRVRGKGSAQLEKPDEY